VICSVVYPGWTWRKEDKTYRCCAVVGEVSQNNEKAYNTIATRTTVALVAVPQ